MKVAYTDKNVVVFDILGLFAKINQNETHFRKLSAKCVNETKLLSCEN